MWGFSEKEIERRLTDREGKRRPLPIETDDVRFVVLATQEGLVLPEKSKRSPWRPLFPELAGLKDFLPEMKGAFLFPDIIARRIFKRGKAKGRRKCLAVIELKKSDATVADVAQLRRYMNLLDFYVEHDIAGIKAKLKVARRCSVRGMLLAPHIPQDVWMSACPTSEPDIDFIAYELISDSKARRIIDINYLDCGKQYAKGLLKLGRKYQADRKHAPCLPIDSPPPNSDEPDRVSPASTPEIETPRSHCHTEGKTFDSDKPNGSPTVKPNRATNVLPFASPPQSEANKRGTEPDT